MKPSSWSFAEAARTTSQNKMPYNAITRRRHMQAMLAALGQVAASRTARAANQNVAYGQTTIPDGIRSRFVKNVNGLTVHMLEAGFDQPNRPCVLLLHGFPELAFSWRKVMLPLAAAGYHVVAPDQRGYGRTTGWDSSYDADLASFSTLNTVRDALALVSALGYRSLPASLDTIWARPKRLGARWFAPTCFVLWS